MWDVPQVPVLHPLTFLTVLLASSPAASIGTARIAFRACNGNQVV